MRNLTLGIILLSAFQAWPHGENKPGPHGGFISMPGAFHVELVPVSSRQLKAYLLDINWKSPTTKNSSIRWTLGSMSGDCTAKENYFVCDFPHTVDLNQKGAIKVTATRAKQKGRTVKYSLPLKFESEH